MDDAVRVCIADCSGQGRGQFGGACGRLRMAGQELLQTAAVAKFQHEERQPALFTDFMDLHDVRMLQACDGLGLTAETGDIVGAGVVAGQNHLEGDDAIQLRLLGPVDDAHASAAEFTENLEAGHREPKRVRSGFGRA